MYYLLIHSILAMTHFRFFILSIIKYKKIKYNKNKKQIFIIY